MLRHFGMDTLYLCSWAIPLGESKEQFTKKDGKRTGMKKQIKNIDSLPEFAS
jgi:hypothetical protein